MHDAVSIMDDVVMSIGSVGVIVLLIIWIFNDRFY